MPWPSIDPGELRHKLTFLTPTIVSDASGSTITYAPAAPPVTARAAMEGIDSNDVIKSGQDITQNIAIFTVRYQPWIQQDMRFTTELGSTWIIKGIQDVEDRHRLLKMRCVGFGPND